MIKKTVYVFGDSIMRGVVEDDESPVSVVPKYRFSNNSFVERCSRDYHVQILNFARFGSTIENGRRQIARHLKDIPPGSYVFLEFGGNDCAFNWKEVAENPEKEHLPITPLKNFVSCYEDIVDQLVSAGVKPVLMSLPAINATRYFKHLSHNLNAANIHHWMYGDINYIINWHELYNIAVFCLARRKNIPIIDVSAVFLEKRNYSDFLCADGIHPNEKGHAMMVQAIHDFVSAEIPEALNILSTD